MGEFAHLEGVERRLEFPASPFENTWLEVEWSVTRADEAELTAGRSEIMSSVSEVLPGYDRYIEQAAKLEEEVETLKAGSDRAFEEKQKAEMAINSLRREIRDLEQRVVECQREMESLQELDQTAGGVEKVEVVVSLERDVASLRELQAEIEQHQVDSELKSRVAALQTQLDNLTLTQEESRATIAAAFEQDIETLTREKHSA
jgi:chromosome segregation ATPase